MSVARDLRDDLAALRRLVEEMGASPNADLEAYEDAFRDLEFALRKLRRGNYLL